MDLESSENQEKKQILLISGFLGAGKTTFLKNLLEAYDDKKVGMLMNEFGEVSIDGIQIRDSSAKEEGINIIEINDGSIFCSCKHYNFIEALIDISKFPIDLLFIESSGISDTSFMNEDLKIVKGIMGDIYEYLGNACVIDAPNFLDQVEMLEVVSRQVKASHIILINKVDTINDDQLDNIKQKIIDLNPRSAIIPTRYCNVSRETLDDLVASVEVVQEAGLLKELDAAVRPLKILLTTGATLERDRLEAFIKKVTGYVLRVKGFCKTSEGWMYVDGVKGRFSITTCDELQDKSLLVVIFRHDEMVKLSIIAAWKELINI